MAESDLEKAKKIATKAQAKKKQLKDEKETSIVPNKLGVTEDFVINANSKHKYTLTLRYPGSEVAMGIIDDCKDGKNGINATDIVIEGINAKVVEAPKELVEYGFKFFDNHDGALEVAGNIANFLMAKLL